MRGAATVSTALVLLGSWGCNGPGRSSGAGTSSSATASPSTSASTPAATPSHPVSGGAPKSAPLATAGLAAGPASPAAGVVAPGTVRAPALQARVTATVGDVLVTRTTFRLAGSIDPVRDMTEAVLVLDSDHDGKFDPAKDVLLGTGTFAGGACTFANAAVRIPSGVAADFLVLLTFSATAQPGVAGAVSLAAADLACSDPVTRSPLSVTGAAQGATLGVGTATSPPPPPPTPPPPPSSPPSPPPPPPGTSSPGTWAVKAAMPTPRTRLAGAVTDKGQLLVAGGATTPTGPALGATELYDPATDTWTKMAPLPTPRLDLAASFLNGRLYAIGGSSNGTDALATVEAFDRVANAWTALAPLPHPRSRLEAAAFQGKILAMGGWDGQADWGGSDIFDPATGQWTAGPTVGYSFLGYPTGVSAFVEDNTKSTTVLMLGNTSMMWLGPITSVGTTATFTLSPTCYFSISSGGAYAYPKRTGAAVFYHQVYFVGGEDPFTGKILSSTQLAEGLFGWGVPSGTGMTPLAPMSTARRNLVALSTGPTGLAVSTGGAIYAIGGDDGTSALGLVEQFTPP